MSNRNYNLICANCSVSFNAGRRDAKYCSPYCRKDAHYKKKAIEGKEDTTEYLKEMESKTPPMEKMDF